MCVHLCYFICLYVPILLCFPEQLSHLPHSFWSYSVTNLNEPPRALAASTVAWVIGVIASVFGRCKQKQRGLRGLLCSGASIPPNTLEQGPPHLLHPRPLPSPPLPSLPLLSPPLRSRPPLLRLGVWGALQLPQRVQAEPGRPPNGIW